MSRRRTNASRSRSLTDSPAPSRRRWALVAIASGAALLIAVAAWLQQEDGADSTPLATDRVAPLSDGLHGTNEPSASRDLSSSNQSALIDLPEIAPTAFRNATTAVAYVGSEACVECHRNEHESYLKTTHSRSLATVDVAHEPADGEFFHELSGRHYRVARDGDVLRLCEFIRDADGREVILGNHVAEYSLGSGNYARMYLVRKGEFLIEAPTTWYPRRNCWGMSAGYERDAHQAGFGREIDTHCLSCHAGRVEAVHGASQLLDVKEMAIGCERCHGPGALHVAERQAKLPIQGEIDDSIVNLRHLSRSQQEDVCSQCHLSGSADVPVQGRKVSDFRPSMRLADFRVSYRIDRPDAAMTVSGQIEQMRLSRCYIESQAMSCATCHNPHARPDDTRKVEHYREKCLNCHGVEACGMKIDERRAKHPNDNCVPCHMPRGPTDIPHFSFTHHRIGIHSTTAAKPKLNKSDHLVPVVDVSHLPKLEQQRLLGLAKDIFAGKLAGGLNDEARDDPEYRELSQVFADRARSILLEVRSQRVLDPDVELFFGRQQWRKNPDLCMSYAISALNQPKIASTSRQSALYFLASSLFDQQQYDQATPYLEELVKIERSEISLMLLAICRQHQGKLSEAVRLIQQAIDDAPDRADLHLYLASVYRQLGDSTAEAQHLRLAQLLQRTVPQPQ